LASMVIPHRVTKAVFKDGFCVGLAGNVEMPTRPSW